MDTSKNPRPHECEHKWESRVFCWECSVIGCMDCHTVFTLKTIHNKAKRWLCPECRDTSEYAKIWAEEKECEKIKNMTPKEVHDDRLKQLFNQMCNRQLLAPLEDRYMLSPPFQSDLLAFCLCHVKNNKTPEHISHAWWSPRFIAEEVVKGLLDVVGIPNMYLHTSQTLVKVVQDQIYLLCEFGNDGHFIFTTDRINDLSVDMQEMALEVNEKDWTFKFTPRQHHPFLAKGDC